MILTLFLLFLGALFPISFLLLSLFGDMRCVYFPSNTRTMKRHRVEVFRFALQPVADDLSIGDSRVHSHSFGILFIIDGGDAHRKTSSQWRSSSFKWMELRRGFCFSLLCRVVQKVNHLQRTLIDKWTKNQTQRKENVLNMVHRHENCRKMFSRVWPSGLLQKRYKEPTSVLFK